MWTPSTDRCTTCATDGAPVGQRLRDLGEHARLVLDVEAQIERALELAHGQPVEPAEVAVVLEEPCAPRADHREQVADHGGRGLGAARARPLEDDLTDGLPPEHHGVEGALDGGERVVAGDEVRVHAGHHGRAGLDGGGDQLRRIAELGPMLDVGEIEPVDADVFDLLQPDAGVKGDRREDGDLGRRVGARRRPRSGRPPRTRAAGPRRARRRRPRRSAPSGSG